MKTLESLRHKLFKSAELSGNEKETNKIINRFLEKTNPDIHLKNVGGYGIIAIYKGVEDGRNIMLRADIDGLNIPLMSTDNGQQATDVFELSAVSTKCQSSKFNSQYSHRCGHDGHAAILCGLAMRLGKKRPAKGNVDRKSVV